jgi:hypothetical protein
VIRNVAANFVPVAVNLYKVRQAKDAGGELFRSVQRQKDQYQGIWIVSPDGQVLAGHHEIKDYDRWAEEVLATSEAGLAAFGVVEPRSVKPAEPLPRRGQGVHSGGSVTLACYARYVLGGGRTSAPAGVDEKQLWLWEGEFRGDGPPVIDSLTLSASEWAAFAPPKAERGMEWTIPQAVARKLCRVLSPTSDQSTMPGPDDARTAELKAVVESAESGRATIRLTGTWETEHTYEDKTMRAWAQAEGTAVLDVRENSLQSLFLVYRGIFRHAPPHDGVRPTGAVVEWRAAPASRK